MARRPADRPVESPPFADALTEGVALERARELRAARGPAAALDALDDPDTDDVRAVTLRARLVAEVQGIVEAMLPLDHELVREVVDRAQGDLRTATALTQALVDREALVEPPDGLLGLRPGIRVAIRRLRRGPPWHTVHVRWLVDAARRRIEGRPELRGRGDVLDELVTLSPAHRSDRPS